jgi:hypothetical protein
MFHLVDEPWLNALPGTLMGIGVFLGAFYTIYHFRSPAQIDEGAWLGGWAGGCFFLAGGVFLELPLDRWRWSVVVATIVLLAWFPLRWWIKVLRAH